MQFIGPDGEKKFFPGAKLRDGFFVIGNADNPETVLVCEGVATGQSLYQETGYIVFVAFNASNLVNVSTIVRAKYPLARLVIAGDNDWQTAERTGVNPGLIAAKKAAAACGGRLIIPPKMDGVSDWNDLVTKGGVHG